MEVGHVSNMLEGETINHESSLVGPIHLNPGLDELNVLKQTKKIPNGSVFMTFDVLLNVGDGPDSFVPYQTIPILVSAHLDISLLMASSLQVSLVQVFLVSIAFGFIIS